MIISLPKINKLFKKSNSKVTEPALLSGIIKVILLLIITYASGCLVYYRGLKVNYTRKINHFALFFIPMFLDKRIPVQPNIELLIIGSFFALGSLIIYIKPIRNNSIIIERMFLSFDRPEDRPNTLLWLSTQLTVGYFIIIPVVFIFFSIGYSDLILIPIIVNGIGDGLAEPIGIKFGKIKYNTYALFSKTKYHRTVEGSLCVFFTSLFVIIVFQSSFSSTEFLFSLVIFPIVMTLAEAYSPHTWDTPFLFFFGYLTLYIIKTIPF